MQTDPSKKENIKSILVGLGALAIFLTIFAAIAWAVLDTPLGLSFLVIVGGGELIGGIMMFFWSRFPKNVADKIPDWIPRILLALVFILPCLALGFINDRLNSQKNKPYFDLINTVLPVCNGEKISSAEPYRHSEIHPIVLIDKQEQRGYIFKDSYPSGWFPQSASDTQLVACIVDKTVKIETCPYSSNSLSSLNIPTNYLETYQHVLSVSVYEASTGKKLDSFDLQGAKPACPNRREFKSTTEQETGANVSNNEIFSSLETFVK